VPSHLNAGRILRLSAQKFGRRNFLEFGDRGYTYANFHNEVNAVAGWLASTGLANGDRVMLLSENTPGYLRMIFALGKLGVVTMPVNVMLTPADIAGLIDLARPRHLVAGERYLDALREARRLSGSPQLPISVAAADDTIQAADGQLVDPVAVSRQGPVPEPTPARPIEDADPAFILFTSGSTGTPKGIVKSHANIAWSAVNHQISEPRRSGDRESFCLSMAGIAFANFILLDALTGATCVLEPGFAPQTLAHSLRSKGITHIFLAPTMIAAMAREVPDAVFPTVRVVETSFEFPIGLRRTAVAMFPNAQILWSFGSTEATMARTPPEYLLTDVSCVGYAGGLDEYRVAARTADASDGIGEVQSYGPTVMMGYLSTDDPTFSRSLGVNEDGWFDTGDLGRIGPDHELHFVGRVKDMIKSGGANVFAGEVESVLVEHPSVQDAAVVGLPDEYWGEVVGAVLEVADPEGIDLDEVRTFVSERLAGFRRPKAYFVVRKLPRNPTGKIAKGQLRADIAAGVLDKR
jgi:fatty-acyl-CoA synthase